MKHIKPIQINVKYEGRSQYETNGAEGTAERALNRLLENLENGDRSTVYIHPQVSLEALTKLLKDHFGKSVSVRDGVSGGCYGARDGKSYKGLTLWFSMDVFPEYTVRVVDQGKEFEYTEETFNWHYLIEEYGGELIEDLDAEALEAGVEAVAPDKVSRNNTYNYAGHSPENPDFLCTAEYSMIQCEDGAGFLCIAFHCGGDVRGNYTDKYVFKFDCFEEIFSVVYPNSRLEEEAS